VSRNGYEDGDRVRLVVPFTSGEGLEYEIGWEGTIAPMFTTLNASQESARYEVDFDDGPGRQNRGLVKLQDVYFERVGDRKPDELRQGDRVYLTSDITIGGKSYPADTTGTVLTTHEPPDGVSHYVAVDFKENIQLGRDALELLGEPPAGVTFSTDGTVRVSFAG
jgi:hypothetical protein